MALFKRPRRYYLLKRRYYLDLDDEAQAGLWRGKQEAEPGTALPATFPLLSRLAAAGYTTQEDLDGADPDELKRASFNQTEADQILAALNDLLP